MNLRIHVTSEFEEMIEDLLDIHITNQGPSDMTSTRGWEDDRHYTWVAYQGSEHEVIAEGQLDARSNKVTMLVHRVIEDLASDMKRRPNYYAVGEDWCGTEAPSAG